MSLSRRTFLGATAASFAAGRVFAASKAKIRIGLLLPYSGTYAALGNNITDAMKLVAGKLGNKLGGREIEWVAVDDESDPAKAPANVNKLISGEKVDILTGPVHSGVAMAMMQIVRQEKTLTIVTNAGAQAVTGQLCAPNVSRDTTGPSRGAPGNRPQGSLRAREPRCGGDRGSRSGGALDGCQGRRRPRPPTFDDDVSRHVVSDLGSALVSETNSSLELYGITVFGLRRDPQP